MFFEKFFSERGPFEPNLSGEVAVLCPFPHDKGYETRPSAHVNVSKGLFHCKTCEAEGRFGNGGLSEIGFVSQLYGIPYKEAAKFIANLENAKEFEEEVWERQQEGLWNNAELMQFLQEKRGLTVETIKKYKLGYPGDGITYPIFIYGELCDIRTYNPNGHPKMRSKRGASPLLFPFDHWRHDPRPTILCAGENDTLLARQDGYNALTTTSGEGHFPKIFLNLFKDKDVYIVYDCDDAGRKSARRVAFALHEAGARVRIVDLGLPGTKDDKDYTDFRLKHGGNLEPLLQQAKIYDGDMAVEDKNIEYPLVDLWNVPEGRFHGKRLSSRVMLSGKYDAAMQVPVAIEWKCDGGNFESQSSPCWSCTLNRGSSPKSGWWTLEENLKEVLYLVDVNEDTQKKNIHNKILGMPVKCPNGSWKVKAHDVVYKVIFTPDVETESGLESYRAVEQYAYTVGLNLEDGARYRAFFRSYPHPLDGQRVYMVVDRVEESDVGVNAFKMTAEIQESLKVFQGDPFVKMKERAEMAKDVRVVGNFANEMVVYATDIMYHSPLRFKFRGKEIKGYPEGLIIGESRTGKSDTAIGLQRYYGVGNFTSVKRATTAGLLGGADKLPSGGFKVSWGTIPRNNKGLVILDEMSGMSVDVMASLTDMRSSGVATVHKIAKGKAPANTRLLWISNPRVQPDGNSLPIEAYPSGVEVVLELVGSDEDIARFDFIMLLARPKTYESPLDEAPVKAYDSILYKNLIYWVWTRTSDQVLWDEGVEEYIWHVSQELNEAFDTNIKFFGAEAWKKLARIAVACAGACFSCSDDGSSILVKKVHVDWANNFLRRCYDNPQFRLAEYVRDRRIYSETNEAVNNIVAAMCRNHTAVIRTLLNMAGGVPRSTLEAVAGLDRNDFNHLVNQLVSNYLVYLDSSGFRATQRLKKAVAAYRETYNESRIVPLSQQGGLPV